MEEEIHAKFRAERKTLQAKITALKKSNAGDKKKKKQVLEEITRMEQDLEQRYQDELLQAVSHGEKDENDGEKKDDNSETSMSSHSMQYNNFGLSKKGPSKQQKRKEKKALELERIRREAEAEDPLVDKSKMELERLAPKLKEYSLEISNVTDCSHTCVTFFI
jgi:hypothetical protein